MFKRHSRESMKRIAQAEIMECRRLLATISGTVYWDHDDNNAINAGDSGVNVPVYADLNDSGSWNLGEPRTPGNPDGTYSLTGLPVGNYYLRVDDASAILANPPGLGIPSAGYSLGGVDLLVVLTHFESPPEGQDF